MISNYGYRRDGKLNSKAFRAKLKAQLLQQDPHCKECGCEVYESPGYSNSAHLVKGHLYCSKHVNDVRQGGKTPKGTMTTASNTTVRRRVILEQLMQYDDRCHACGMRLTAERDRSNSAVLVDRRLSCPAHARIVHDANYKDREFVVLNLTTKGREYLDSHRPLIQLVEAWFVDGEQFDSIEAAEEHAQQLARVLGVKIEIQVGLIDGDKRRTAQIVRPGDDARRGDASYHRRRRSLIDYAKR